MLFGEIRKYCSRIDCVDICMKETLSYEHYETIMDVPSEYDKKCLHGFGVIESDSYGHFRPCMEFVLSEKPRDFSA